MGMCGGVCILGLSEGTIFNAIQKPAEDDFPVWWALHRALCWAGLRAGME